MGTGCVLTPSKDLKMSEPPTSPDMSYTGGCKRGIISADPPSKKSKIVSLMDIQNEELVSGQKGVIVAPKLNDAVQIKVFTAVDEIPAEMEAASMFKRKAFVQQKTSIDKALSSAMLLDLQKMFSDIKDDTCPSKKKIAQAINELIAEEANEASDQEDVTADQSNDYYSDNRKRQRLNGPKVCCFTSHKLLPSTLLTAVHDNLIDSGFFNMAKVFERFQCCIDQCMRLQFVEYRN